MARCDQFSLVSEKSGEGVLVALGVLPNSTLHVYVTLTFDLVTLTWVNYNVLSISIIYVSIIMILSSVNDL